MSRVIKPLILIGIGGLIYVVIEMLWRGRSHWTMFFVGGIAFYIVGMLNEWITWDIPFWRQVILAAVTITVLELIAGLIINHDYSIWDYRNQLLNIKGQICLLYSLLWMVLAIPAIILDDYLRYWIMGEEKPHYRKNKAGRD